VTHSSTNPDASSETSHTSDKPFIVDQSGLLFYRKVDGIEGSPDGDEDFEVFVVAGVVRAPKGEFSSEHRYSVLLGRTGEVVEDRSTDSVHLTVADVLKEFLWNV
jgi:hypothetical protein